MYWKPESVKPRKYIRYSVNVLETRKGTCICELRQVYGIRELRQVYGIRVGD